MTPPTSPPGSARLAAALRELKERTDLSLAGLAERTAFSKSSWERYLNGKSLPPCPAVRALCRLARASDERYVALWEIAESEWRGRAAKGTRAATPEPGEPGRPFASAEPSPTTETRAGTPEPDPQTPPAPPPLPGPPDTGDSARPGRRRTATAVIALACAVVAVGAMAVILRPDHDDTPQPLSARSPLAALCQGAACEGRNPMHMHCAGRPDTLASHRTSGGAWLELRFSEECGAGWARMWSTRVGDRLEITAAGRTQTARVDDRIDAEAYVYTAILAAAPGTAVRACFHAAAGGPAECFDALAVD